MLFILKTFVIYYYLPQKEVDIMSININLGAWSSVFAVPSKIVDEGLKFSDGVKLKVLLYVLRNAGKNLTDSDISAATGVNVTDIPEALDYWVNMGVLCKSNGEFTPVQQEENQWKPPICLLQLFVFNPLGKWLRSASCLPIQVPWSFTSTSISTEEPNFPVRSTAAGISNARYTTLLRRPGVI